MRSKPVKFLIRLTQRKAFPGYPEVSWYAVIEFFIRWIDQRDMKMRASSLSFTFFLALFPSVIFFFTLIAYIPFGRTTDEILSLFSDIMPESAFETVETTLTDILGNQRKGLLSIGFLSAVYFSTEGFHSLMNTLNKYGKSRETRPFWKQRLVAFILGIVVAVSILLSVLMITVGSFVIDLLDQFKYFPSRITPLLLSLLSYVIVAGIVLTIVSTIYYLAPNKNGKWKFISPGSVFACITIMVSTSMFSLYVNEFNSYNKVYGSIGVLIVIMMLIYINTYILLLGYELNVSIDKAAEETSKGNKIKANRVVYLKAVAEGMEKEI
jgi:membrane protein